MGRQNKQQTKQTMKASSSSSSQRAKARWKMLRQALLTRPNNERIKDDNEDVAATTQEYSIHKFPGFQMMSRQIIPRLGEEHRDYDLVRYEIPFPDDIQITNRNNTTTTTTMMSATVAADTGGSFPPPPPPPPTCIVIHTLEPSQQDKNVKKKMNIEKELMSHVHYGVDNTGNTRVWDCSNVLASVIFQKGNQEKVDEKKKRTSILVVGQEEEGQLENHQNEPALFGNLTFSKKKPLVSFGLDNIILSLATVRQRRQQQWKKEKEDNDDDDDDNNSSKCRKILRVLELGAGMAALPSLTLAVLGKHFKKWNEEQQQQCGTQQSLEQYPKIHVTITDGHPRAVANNVACIQRTMGRDDDDNDDNADDSIHCCRLLWKRNQQGQKECQELLMRATSMLSNNVTKDGQCDDKQHSQQQNDHDGFDLILVSDCLHFTDFHVDLAMTIGRLLRVGGVCLLCQPARGTSLEQFLHLIHCINGYDEGYCEKEGGEGEKKKEETTTMTNMIKERTQQPLFQVDLHNQYHPDLYEKHVRLMNDKNENDYVPNIHYPLLLELKKIGNFCEELHGGRAIDWS
jgi:Putative methyltransferase.